MQKYSNHTHIGVIADFALQLIAIATGTIHERQLPAGCILFRLSALHMLKVAVALHTHTYN